MTLIQPFTPLTSVHNRPNRSFNCVLDMMVTPIPDGMNAIPDTETGSLFWSMFSAQNNMFEMVFVVNLKGFIHSFRGERHLTLFLAEIEADSLKGVYLGSDDSNAVRYLEDQLRQDDILADDDVSAINSYLQSPRSYDRAVLILEDVNGQDL